MSVPVRGQDGEEETDTEKRYEKVLRTVEYRTGGPTSSNPQPPAVKETAVVAAGSRRYDSAGIRRSIKAAEDNDDLLRLRIDGTVRLARTDEDSLRELARWAAEREDPIRHVVAKANRAMD